LDDGQRLLALNEIFLGHRTHQSARYRVQWKGEGERHSTSGIIISTGTGATGWARSIHLQRRTQLSLPKPTELRLAFFVREPFPSVATGTRVTEGALDAQDQLLVTSEMNEGGVIFGDGIEKDRIDFEWGRCAKLRLASIQLRLALG